MSTRQHWATLEAEAIDGILAARAAVDANPVSSPEWVGAVDDLDWWIARRAFVAAAMIGEDR